MAISIPKRTFFERVSQKNRFQIDNIEKVYRLAALLANIYDHPTLSKISILRGGTAINFIYLNYPRLSIDIDLDYVGSVEKNTMLEERTVIDSSLGTIFGSFGYEIETVSNHYALAQYYLKYTNSVGNSDRIKVEINYLNRLPVLDACEETIDLSSLGWNASFQVQTLRLEELMASKVVALMSRLYPRDLYDVYRLSNLAEDLDINLVHKLVACLGCIEEVNFLDLTPDVVDRLAFHDIKRELIPLLRKGEPINLNKMKREAKQLLKLLLKRDEVALAFLKEFYEGKFNPHLLFGDYSVNPRLAEHPGVKWRLQNLTNEQRKESLRKLGVTS